MQDILLVVTWSDGHKEQRIPLFGQTIRFGHDAYNDIVLPPEFRPHAPYHAAVILEKGNCYIYDPDGIGAIYLNGKRLVGTGIITSDIPAYIGYPSHRSVYLRLSLLDMQFTQVVKSEADMGATALVHLIEAMPPPTELPESVIPYLLAGWSAENNQIFELDQDAIIFGRSPTANIILPDTLKFVSGLHFQLIRIERQFYIQDKASTNGTHLNRLKLEPNRLYLLTDGDIISIQAGSASKLLWFVYHDPLNPRVTNIARKVETEVQTEKSRSHSLWERVWHFLANG